MQKHNYLKVIMFAILLGHLSDSGAMARSSLDTNVPHKMFKTVNPTAPPQVEVKNYSWNEPKSTTEAQVRRSSQVTSNDPVDVFAQSSGQRILLTVYPDGTLNYQIDSSTYSTVMHSYLHRQGPDLDLQRKQQLSDQQFEEALRHHQLTKPSDYCLKLISEPKLQSGRIEIPKEVALNLHAIALDAYPFASTTYVNGLPKPKYITRVVFRGLISTQLERITSKNIDALKSQIDVLLTLPEVSRLIASP